MKNNPTLPPGRHEPSEDEIRMYAYYLYEQSDCAPGRDLDNWLEATACLQANIPLHRSGTRLPQQVSGPESGELHAVTIGARTLLA